MAKQLYYKNRIGISSNKQRETWKIGNEIRGKAGKSTTETSLLPCELNSFYCSVAENISKSLPRNLNFNYFFRHIGECESFYFTPITIHEIRQIFSDIKSNKASGWDGISVRLFLKLPDSALEVMADAINLSFQTGIFPGCLKRANIIPLFKGGDSNNPSNYRPVALLPTLSKIIEKLAKKRIVSFLENHQISKDSQFGFRSGKGTNDAIFNFLESLYLTLNDGDAAAAVFCDLSKAFDCVSHKILLRKLEAYGFRGQFLKWIESYLSERVQVVSLGGVTSEPQKVTYGVPQGSVLGPILFLLYVNDLAELNISGKFTMYADDATILWRGDKSGNIHLTINEDLKKIKLWCDANNLCFNVSKTSVMSFKCNVDVVYLNDIALDCLNENKFLGLYIDNKLKFNLHISNLCAKVSSNTYAIKIVARELDRTTIRNTYFALIESHLRYGICFWGTCSRQLFQSVFVLQKRAIRCMFGVKTRDSCKPLFLREQILTLYSLFILETVCLLHKKFKNDICATSSYNTRRTFTISLPIPTTSQVRDSFVFTGRQMFNNLPLCIREITVNDKKFKLEVKKLLAARAYYSIEEYLSERF